MIKTVFGIFETRDDAQGVISKLKHHNYNQKDISIKTKGSYEQTFIANKYGIVLCLAPVFDEKISEGAILIAVRTHSSREADVRIIMHDFDAIAITTMAEGTVSSYRHAHLVFPKN